MVPNIKVYPMNALAIANNDVAIVAWVCRCLKGRTSSYAYALERLVIRTPSPLAVETERSIAMLSTRIGLYCKPAAGAVLVAKD